MSAAVGIGRAASMAAWRRQFLAGRGGVIGSVLVILLVLGAVFAPLLAPHGPNDQMRQAILHPPTWLSGAYPLGTDDVGRDILSRLIYGARLSLSIGAMVVALASIVGTCSALPPGSRAASSMR